MNSPWILCMSALTPEFPYTDLGQVLVSATYSTARHCPTGRSMVLACIHIDRIESVTFDKNLVVVYLWDWYGDNVQLSWLRAAQVYKLRLTSPGLIAHSMVANGIHGFHPCF